MMHPFKIGDRTVGPGHPCYVIAELSGNHNGDLARAVESIRAAATAGADAVKIQTYTADTMTLDLDSEDFVVPGDGPWAGRTLYDLYREAHTPWEWHAELFDAAHEAGIQIFSSPFDRSAVDLLERLGSPAYKIASFELVDDGLIDCVARTGKPVIVSTGMGSLEEIAHAVDLLRKGGCEAFALLKCTSSYPAPDSGMNLRAIDLLARTFDCPVGLSDHSQGTVAPTVATCFGSIIVEKHFTLSRADGGVDSHFSVEPAELAEMIAAIRRAEDMIGLGTLDAEASDEGSRIFRRSLYVTSDLAPGDELSEENVRSIRPGYGLPPRHLPDVLGRPVMRTVPRGTPVSWDLFKSTDQTGPDGSKAPRHNSSAEAPSGIVLAGTVLGDRERHFEKLGTTWTDSSPARKSRGSSGGKCSVLI